MTRLLVFDPTRGFQSAVPPGQIATLLQQADALLWLDMTNPTAEEREILHRDFNFHPLAVEDIEHAHQRPKIEQYEHFYLMVFYTLAAPAAAEAGLCTSEMALFVGPNYLVTVHTDPLPVLDEVAHRWQANPAGTAPGVAGLLHAILDAVVDDYFPVVDDFGDRIDDLEERIFAAEENQALLPIFQLKKDLLALRRIVAPERDVVNVLMRRELPFIAPGLIVYFQDVYDHLVRLTDSVDTFRDLLTSALDAHLSVVSNRLNQVMKTLTAISAVLMSAALIAGIYGMNFRYMPELQWRYGYLLSLAIMVAIASALAIFFRRKGWW